MKKILALLCLTLCLCTGCLGEIEPSTVTETIKAGDALPALSLVKSDGKEVKTEDLKGHPSVIVFFNTGCSDCRKGLPVIQKLYDDEAYQGIQFLCVSRSQEETSVRKYWQDNALTLPFSAQADNKVFLLFASQTIPRVYVADAGGIVRKVLVEKVKEETLREALNEVAKSAPAE